MTSVEIFMLVVVAVKLLIQTVVRTAAAKKKLTTFNKSILKEQRERAGERERERARQPPWR